MLWPFHEVQLQDFRSIVNRTLIVHKHWNWGENATRAGDQPLSWGTKIKRVDKHMRSEGRARTFFHLLDLRFLLVNCRAQQGEDDASLRVHPDRRYQHFTWAFHHVGAWQNHGVKRFALLDVIRLSRKRRFINLQKNNNKYNTQTLSNIHIFK